MGYKGHLGRLIKRQIGKIGHICQIGQRFSMVIGQIDHMDEMDHTGQIGEMDHIGWIGKIVQMNQIG